MNALMGLSAVTWSLEKNPHRCACLTVGEWWESIDGDLNDWSPGDCLERSIETDQIYQLVWYHRLPILAYPPLGFCPTNLVGSYHLFASTLEGIGSGLKALEAAECS